MKNSEKILLFPIAIGKNDLVTGWIAVSINFEIILEQTNKELEMDGVKIKVYIEGALSFNSLIFQKNVEIDPKKIPAQPNAWVAPFLKPGTKFVID